MNRLNRTFTPHTIARASEMNEVVAKVNELVDGKLDLAHNSSASAHQDLFAQTVKTTGNQSIAGRKTITGSLYMTASSELVGRGSVLCLDATSQKVTPDSMPYMRLKGQIGSYSNLPSADATQAGDVWHITDSGDDYYARSVTMDNNLYVNILPPTGVPDTVQIVIDTDTYTPITTTELSVLLQSATWSAEYPNVAASQSNIGADTRENYLGFGSSRICFVPVRVENFGLIVVMVDYQNSTRHPWALGVAGATANPNTWEYHIHGQGEVINVSNGVYNQNNVKTFQVAGGSVVWESMGGVVEESDPVFNQWVNNEYDEAEAIETDEVIRICS